MVASGVPSGPSVPPTANPACISVFFPCYNEQDNISQVVAQAVKVLDDIHADFELIIVDDGSSDRTGPVADELARQDERIRVVHHPHNLGYGSALRSGFSAAAKELVFFTDGDGQFDLADLPPLLPLMQQYDIVAGYRRRRSDNLLRILFGWLWTKITGILLGLQIRDVDCAFKLYKRSIFDHITLSSTGALINAEILARAAAKGYKMTQRPVRHYPRLAGKQTGATIRVVLRAFKELLALRRRILKG